MSVGIEHAMNSLCGLTMRIEDSEDYKRGVRLAGIFSVIRRMQKTLLNTTFSYIDQDELREFTEYNTKENLGYKIHDLDRKIYKPSYYQICSSKCNCNLCLKLKE